MKKYLSIAAAAAMVLTGCTEGLYGPTPTPEAKVDAKGIAIQISEAADSSFVLTLTPEDTSALFYSYAVVEGELKSVDSTVLYAGGYKNAVASDVIKNVAPYSTTLTVSGLTPYSTYTVYAVASSSTGVVGAVASKSVKTSDSEAPTIVEESLFFDAIKNVEVGNVVAIQFSEPVALATNAKATVKYYGIYSSSHNILNDENIGTGSAEIVVEGDIVEFVVSDVPAGAHYSVSFDEGTFVDAAGLKAEGLESGYLVYRETPAALGLVGRIEPESFSFVADSVASVADLTAGISLALPEGVVLGDYDDEVTASVCYEVGSEVRTYSDIEPFEAGGNLYTLSKDFSSVIVTPNAKGSNRQDPERGSTVTITIPEGWLYDIYGNPSAEYTVGPFIYSYGYEAETALYGTYVLSSKSGYASYGYGPYEDVITISASDDAKKGNTLISGTLADAPFKFYGDFDEVQGTLTISAWQVIGSVTDYVYDENGYPTVGEDGQPIEKDYHVTFALTPNGGSFYDNDFGFDIPAPHTLSWWYTNSAFLGLLELDDEGEIYNIYDAINITKVTYTPSAASSPAPSAARRAAKLL